MLTHKRLGIIGAITFSLLIHPTLGKAGCKSDCEDEYSSEKESCMFLHDEPDEADYLRMCIDNAKSEYDDCIGECDS